MESLWQTQYKVHFTTAARLFFHQTLSVNANPLDLFDQPLLLDMIFLGTPQLRGGVNIFIFFKVSFEKHPTVHKQFYWYLVTNLN